MCLMETLGAVLSPREERVLFWGLDWLRVGSGSRELEEGIFERIRWIGWMVGNGISSNRRRRGMLSASFACAIGS